MNSARRRWSPEPWDGIGSVSSWPDKSEFHDLPAAQGGRGLSSASSGSYIDSLGALRASRPQLLRRQRAEHVEKQKVREPCILRAGRSRSPSRYRGCRDLESTRPGNAYLAEHRRHLLGRKRIRQGHQGWKPIDGQGMWNSPGYAGPFTALK